MEKKIEQAGTNLLNVILESDTYRNYRKAVSRIKQEPDLLNKVFSYRKRTIDSYSDPGNQDLLDKSDRILRDYHDILLRPEVIAYMDAEDELVRTLQKLSDRIVAQVKIEVPSAD